MSVDTTIFKSGVTLAVLAAVCTALVATTYHLTAEQIEANDKALLEQSLQPALADIFYDSGVSESLVVMAPPHELPGPGPALVYRVYAAGQPVAALFVVTARDGFSGPIRILLGVGLDGTVTGLRILKHQETPGLGDKIDSSRSDWVEQFPGRSLGDPPVTGWAIRSDGGEFDQLTGASVTPRAVLKAMRDTLVWFEANKEVVFDLPASGDEA